jgi:hypothetical protein
MEKLISPESEFQFSLEAYLTKATGEKIEKKDDLDFNNMWVQGIASDNETDLEGEQLSPRTFYTDYFMKVGKITFEHKSADLPLTAIGEPRETKITPNNEFFVKGILYGTNPLAKQVYEQTYILQSDPNSTRRMQWSVEGKRIMKENKPVGLLVTHVTLTQNPINYKNTYAEVVKKAFSENFEPNISIDLDPLREAELMLFLHKKDPLIFHNLQKALKYCYVLDYWSKKEESLNFFNTNTFNKLDQLINLDVKKSLEYCDLIYNIVDAYPAANDYFNNTNIIEICDKIVR